MLLKNIQIVKKQFEENWLTVEFTPIDKDEKKLVQILKKDRTRVVRIVVQNNKLYIVFSRRIQKLLEGGRE